MMQQIQPKKKLVHYTTNNVLESIRDVGGSVGSAVKTEVVSKIATDALTAIFNPIHTSGELRPNQVIEFGTKNQEKTIEMPTPKRMDTLVSFVKKDQEQMQSKLAEIRSELQNLAKSITSLQTEITQATNTMPEIAGVYHINFFEQLKLTLMHLREQVDNSKTWMEMFNTRKNNKKYWGKYKKHGTSFGLSSERSTATQSG